MKIKTVIFYALLTLLCLLAQSCKRFSLYSEKDTPFHYSALKAITDTMTCCPNAALGILINVSDTVDESKLSKPDYYEYQILIAEALFKNDLMQTNDLAVFGAVSYYDSLAQIYPENVDVLFQKSRAHYYNAVGESEKNDIKKACAEYLMSLKTMNHIKGKDRTQYMDYFNGLIYNRLSEIYYNFTCDLAFQIYKKANDEFIKCRANYPIAINFSKMAKLLATDNRYDESEMYLAMADSLLCNDLIIDECDKDRLRDAMLMTKALNLCDAENRHYEALCIMKRCYNHDDESKIIKSVVLAEMYYQNSIIDSALYYYEMAVENNHPAKMTAISRIVDICKILGDNEKAACYAPLLAEETNQELELAPLKAELVAMYEQYETDRHKAEIRGLWLRIIMAFTVGVIIIVFVFCVVSITRKKRHKNEINKKNRYISTLHGKIKKMKVENKSAKENIKSLENKLVGLNDTKNRKPVSFEDGMRIIKTDELCKRLVAVTQMHIKTTAKYPELLMNSDERLHLVNLFDKEFNGALHAIISKHSRLKKSDELHFCLYLLGFDDKHVAAVTGKSYNNVFMRLKKCLEILGGGENLQEAIILAISKSDII